MSLDKNLFTLQFTPNPDDPNGIDLVDPSGVVHYRKLRVQGATYEINVSDPISGSLLIRGSSPNPTSRHKTLELFNPSIVVELKDVGKVSFRWSFKWEDHDFEWKKDECYMIRKPDPPVLVAVTSEPPSRIKNGTVQILDYNLNRFDIADRKGLEIVILTALFTFSDLNESYHAATEGRPGLPRLISPGAPPVPPKPEPRVGIERIAEMQAFKGEVNELAVEDEGEVEDYAGHGWNLLQDEAMLFISVRSTSAENVPKVLRVVEEIKRLRHKAGLDEEGELHQYAIYEQQKGPKIIKLDNPKGKNVDLNYTPPTSLTVHLSKIDMPELKPRANAQPPDKNIVREWEKEKEKEKERKKEKGKEKEKPTRKDKRKEDDKKQKESSPPGKLAKPPASSSKPPSPGHQFPPPIPHQSRPTSSVWELYPAQFHPPLYQQQPQSGTLNAAAPPTIPPPLGSVVSNLIGRLDRFTKR